MLFRVVCLTMLVLLCLWCCYFVCVMLVCSLLLFCVFNIFVVFNVLCLFNHVCVRVLDCILWFVE